MNFANSQSNVVEIGKEESNKMLSATQNNQVIRNYIIAAISVILFSVGIADLFNSSARVAKEKRLNNYDRFVSFGLVSMEQKHYFR